MQIIIQKKVFEVFVKVFYTKHLNTSTNTSYFKTLKYKTYLNTDIHVFDPKPVFIVLIQATS